MRVIQCVCVYIGFLVSDVRIKGNERKSEDDGTEEDDYEQRTLTISSVKLRQILINLRQN